MDERPHGTNRRDFLKAVGLGALGTVAAGGAATTLGWGLADAEAATVSMALAGTDGYITVPGRTAPVYIMGFVPVSPTASVSSLIATYKGHAQHVAPIFGFRQGDDIRITLHQPGPGPAARPHRHAHHPLARLRCPVPAERRCPGGVGRGADRQAGDVLLPPAP